MLKGEWYHLARILGLLQGFFMWHDTTLKEDGTRNSAKYDSTRYSSAWVTYYDSISDQVTHMTTQNTICLKKFNLSNFFLVINLLLLSKTIQ